MKPVYTIRDREGAIPRLILRDASAQSQVEIAPSRGGMVTRFAIDDTELLYLDPESFEDTSRNVRGGVPVLFPTPGKLEGDRWSRDGKSGSMTQHGFGRKLPWEVVERETTGGVALTLELRSSEETRAQYPWDFVARYTYRLIGERLRVDMSIHNTGSEVMPFGVGFHPYFYVPQAEKGEVVIETDASRAFDNVAKEAVDFEGFDLTRPEVDTFLLDHSVPRSSLTRPDGTRIEVRGSATFSHWVVWTLEGRDFVCLEPWSCPGDALNTGDRLILLAPDVEHTLWMEIAVTD